MSFDLGPLFKAVVINGMGKGFRRAGISLTTGTNDVEINVNQLQQMEADPNLTVDVLETVKESLVDAAQDAVLTLTAAKLNLPLATVISVIDLVGVLRKDDELRHGFVDNAVNNVKQAAVKEATDFIDEKVGKGIEGLIKSTTDIASSIDLSTADEFLHPIIQMIDVLSEGKVLDKKPNVSDLIYQAEQGGEHYPVTPSAAQRDEAWQWYQDNIKVVNAEPKSKEDDKLSATGKLDSSNSSSSHEQGNA